MQTELFIDTEPNDIISKDIIAFLALANLQGIGYWTLYNIAKKGISFGSFFSYKTIDEFNSIYGKILHKQFPTDDMPWIIVKRHLWEAGIKYLRRLEQHNIKLIFYTDPEFPPHIKTINEPPYWLFYEGSLDNLQRQGVCIVGARVTPPLGIFLAQYATYSVKSLEVPTISGLATGIDQIVHQVSIESGIPTIAVLGTGILKNYPTDSVELRKSIIKNGGTIVSEYLPHANYSAENFVRRNRIQAALCKILIPAYWRIKSGTAHTVEFAFKMDRKIICLQTIDKNETFDANNFAIRTYESNNFIIPNDHEKLINCLTSTNTSSKIKKQMEMDL